MSKKNNIVLALAVVGIGVGAAWWFKRRSGDAPGLIDWEKTLAIKYGDIKSRQIADRVRGQYPFLLCRQALPENSTLRWHVTKNILPGLALYQALLAEHGGDQQTALAAVDEIFRARVLPRTGRMLAPLKYLSDPYRLLLRVFDGIMKVYPAEGWDFEYVEKSDARIAFNCTRCFYLNTLTALGAPELTASFCKSDDVMAENFPPQIGFVRLHTLGRGDDVCDFQYIHRP